MKTIILSGLLVVVLAVIGTSAWLMANRPVPGNQEIAIQPGPGSTLTNSNGDLSQVFMKTVQVEKTVSDQEYLQISPNHTVKPGNPILTLTLSIQNMHPEYKIIGISVMGYDSSGALVATTLDDPLHAMAWTQLDYQETGNVTVHLSFSNNIRLIKIFGNNYQYAVP